MGKITMQDIRNIKVGSSSTFTVDHPREIDTIRTLAYKLNSMEPELKRRFSCSSDFKNRKVTVTANPL